MAGNKKPPKRHKPATVRKTKGELLAEMAVRLAQTRARQSKEPLDASQCTDLLLRLSSAWAALDTGEPTTDDLGTLGMACNTVQVLLETGLGAEYADVCEAAGKALTSVNQRWLDTGRIGMTGLERIDVAHMLDLYREMIHSGQVTEGMLMAALDETDRRIDRQIKEEKLNKIQRKQ